MVDGTANSLGGAGDADATPDKALIVAATIPARRANGFRALSPSLDHRGVARDATFVKVIWMGGAARCAV
jgi:hypothetical protein